MRFRIMQIMCFSEVPASRALTMRPCCYSLREGLERGDDGSRAMQIRFMPHERWALEALRRGTSRRDIGRDTLLPAVLRLFVSLLIPIRAFVS